MNRKRFDELKIKFGHYEKRKPIDWMYGSDYGNPKKAETFLHKLDAIAAETIRHYGGTDWAIDRKKAAWLLKHERSFVFLPRENGCALLVPGRASFKYYEAYSAVEAGDGIRYIFVRPDDYIPYIVEEKETCDNFMQEWPETNLCDILWFTDGCDTFTVVKDMRETETVFLAVRGYDNVKMTYAPLRVAGEVLGAFDNAHDAKLFIKGLSPQMVQTDWAAA